MSGGVREEKPAVLFEATNGITLRIATREHDGKGYPSGMIRKGLTISRGPVDLSEEGVGFGVPVLKQPRETIFPGTLRVAATCGGSVAVAEYEMDLVERLSLRTRRSLVSAVLNAVREPLALLHRRYPLLRNALSGVSNTMRSAFGIRTTFVHTESLGCIRVTYRFEAARGKVRVHVEAPDFSAEKRPQLIIMNEQGAHFFDRYVDSTGCTRQGAAIETWQEVVASRATFHDSLHGVFFSIESAPGARLFRGRELVEGRLAWAGLAHVLPPGTREFSYDISIGSQG